MLQTASNFAVNGILYYFIALNFCYLLLAFRAFRAVRNSFFDWRDGKISSFIQRSSLLPKITVLIPAHNEQQRLISTIHGVLKSNYTSLELVIINDGSTDQTLPLLLQTFNMIVEPIAPNMEHTQLLLCQPILNTYRSIKYPNIIAVDKAKGGKADALNAGLHYTNTELFLTIDADTCVEADAIDWLAFTVLSNNDGIAAGGVLYASDEYHSPCAPPSEIDPIRWKPLLGIQTIEYIRSFLFGRTPWNVYNGPLILSGALSLFLTRAVMNVKGFNTQVPSEDMEIVVNLHQYHLAHKIPYQISHVPSATGWTIVPDSMDKLWRQRSRWHLGLFDSLLKNKRILFNYRYNPIGFFNFPFQLFGEFLGPFIELLGYCFLIWFCITGTLNLTFALLFFFVSLGSSSIYTTMAILCHTETFNKQQRPQHALSLIFYIFLENAGYRQFLALCYTFAIFRKLGTRLWNRNKNRPPIQPETMYTSAD